MGVYSEKNEFVVYKKRWLILCLFILYSMSNAFQWTQLVIISNILETYYNVGTLAVSWTSLIFMVTYIPLIFPACWFLQKKGLRSSVLMGAFGTCLGSWIKVFGTGRTNFIIVFLGQSLVAISQVFILGIPAQLAATWFPSQQVSSACAFGVFGNQLGVALGFILPATFVKNQSEEDKMILIGNDLFYMFLGVAIFTSLLLITILFGFDNAPKTPPSRAQKTAGIENENYYEGIKRLIYNKNYLLLLISYGCNVGVFYAVSTLLNAVINIHFEDASEDSGRIGLVIVLFGMAGSMICGFILDKTQAFKNTVLFVYLFTFLGMVVYTFSFDFSHIAFVYVSAGFLGFFMTGYLPIGFELGAEITFPESEGTSCGLLNASAQIFGIACTLISERILELTQNDKILNGFLTLILLLGTCLTVCIKSDYRRQAAAASPDAPAAPESSTEPPLSILSS